MFRPGPSSTATSCAAASSPRASPMASPRAGSQLLATVALVGETGGRDTGVQAQMVRRARLLAHAVGAVREG